LPSRLASKARPQLRAEAGATLARPGSLHIDSTSIADIAPIVRANIKRETELMTDEARHSRETGQGFTSHTP
jgi:hypothetical protein